MLNVLSDLTSKSKLEDLRGGDVVVAWFLCQALKKLKYPFNLIGANSEKVTTADNTLVIGKSHVAAMKKKPSLDKALRENTKRKVAVYLDSETYMAVPFDITFTMVEPKTAGDQRGKFVYAGFGVDPIYCYSEENELTIFYDIAQPRAISRLPEREQAIHRTYKMVLPSLGCEVIKNTRPLLWRARQQLLRGCDFYIEAPNRARGVEGGLNRLEASACGALIVLHEAHYEGAERTLDRLSYTLWADDDELRHALSIKVNREAISRKAQKNTWEAVVRRVIEAFGA